MSSFSAHGTWKLITAVQSFSSFYSHQNMKFSLYSPLKENRLEKEHVAACTISKSALIFVYDTCNLDPLQTHLGSP